MALREIGVGYDVTRVLFMMIGLAILVWLAMWAGAAFLVLWLCVRMVQSRQRAIPGWATGAAVAAAVASGAFLLQRAAWWVLAVAVAAVLLAVIAWVLGDMSSPVDSAAVVVSLALGVATLLFGGFAVREAIPEVLQIEVERYGDTATMDAAFNLAGCLAGSTEIDIDTSPFSYETGTIEQVGKCSLSRDEDYEPIFFFRAKDAAALDDWLSSGKLMAEHGEAWGVALFRHGAVAVASTETDSTWLLADTDFRKLYVKN